MREGEADNAYTLFHDALLILNDNNELTSKLNESEVIIGRQMALRNLGYYYEYTGDIQMGEVHYLRALCEFRLMHVGTIKKTIFALMKIWARNLATVDRVRDLVHLASRLDFDIGDVRAIGSVLPKRVVFAMDYSFSMYGPKLETAVRSLSNLYERCIQDADSCSLIAFNATFREVVSMNTKREDGENMRRAIRGLTNPQHGTALIDAMTRAFRSLTPTTGNDWVVVLTDGSDSTGADPTDLSALLSESTVGLIIIGIGEDVKEDALVDLCQPAGGQRGHFLRASADPMSIQSAFNRVGEILQSDVIFQTMY